MIRGWFCTVLLGFTSLTLGCNHQKYVPVQGQLVFPDGSPATGLEGGQVIFHSTSADGTKSTATGPLDAEGRFKLGTDVPGDGALAGRYQVAVSPPTSSGDVPKPRVIDPKYEKFETSGLDVDVTTDSKPVTLTVQRAGKK